MNIIRKDASTACQVNNDGEHQGQYDLISNAQWMTLAHNIASDLRNWNLGRGPVGTGTLNRGNSNSTSVLAAGRDDMAYIGLPRAQLNDWIHKRTHTLSNDEVIWDMAGNVWEWVLDKLITKRHQGNEYTSQYFPNGSPFRNLYAPLGNYNSTQNTGRFYMWNSGAALRGGGWDDDTDAGVFATFLLDSPTGTSERVGFRCTFVPVQY
jgi:formylglycine-generating enzyme required for sulfatase activity